MHYYSKVHSLMIYTPYYQINHYVWIQIVDFSLSVSKYHCNHCHFTKEIEYSVFGKCLLWGLWKSQSNHNIVSEDVLCHFYATRTPSTAFACAVVGVVEDLSGRDDGKPGDIMSKPRDQNQEKRTRRRLSFELNVGEQSTPCSVILCLQAASCLRAPSLKCKSQPSCKCFQLQRSSVCVCCLSVLSFMHRPAQ